MKIPEFETKAERLEWLKANRDKVIAAKKAEMKKADAVYYIADRVGEQSVDKAYKPITDDIDQMKVRVVINTTNLMDSHDDVHIPGIWNKSLKENKYLMHLQEHVMAFDHIIADGADVKAYAQDMTWKELGQKWEGTTQALVFESTLTKDRNPFMFDQYRKARVRNHSVGMYYVKILLAVDDEDDYWEDEKKTWDKYISQVVNRERAEAQGYFYAVLEAKAVEGSAVPMGSNWVTPPLDNDLKSEPVDTTRKEPVTSTLSHEEIMKRILKF